MFRSHLILAFRKLMSAKFITALHLSGLVTGFVTCFTIYLFVTYELNHDRFHVNGYAIFRVLREHKFNDEQQLSALTSGPLADAMKEHFGEVAIASRILMRKGIVLVNERYKNQEPFVDQAIAFADGSIAEIFSFAFTHPDTRSALDAPGAIFLSREAAKRYFGDEDPINKVISFDRRYTFTVKGMLGDIPGNSHLHFDAIASLATLNGQETWLNDWRQNRLFTYVLLDNPDDHENLQPKMSSLIDRYLGSSARAQVGYRLQPLFDIHSNPAVTSNAEPGRSKKVIYIFSSVGVFILLLACINYVNLSTAYSISRSKEIGVRKVLGALRRALVGQFLQESILVVSASVCAALLITYLLLPHFNDLMNTSIVIPATPSSLLTVLLIALLMIGVVGILAGIYPALYLSRFDPSVVLRKTGLPGLSGAALRKSLIVFQFSLTVILISATLIIRQQMDFMKTTDPGFRKEDLMLVTVNDKALLRQIDFIKERLAGEHAFVSDIASADNIVGFSSRVNARRIHDQEDTEVLMSRIACDFDFLKTMQLTLVAGRDFSLSNPSDSLNAIIINEKAVRKLGWRTAAEAVGSEIEGVRFGDNKKSEIIGVIRDFNFASFYHEIEPLFIVCEPREVKHLIVRFADGTPPSQSVEALKKTWKEIAPGPPAFTYEFVTDKIDRFYQDDARLEALFNIFVVLSVVVSCLGLFGLTLYMAEQRAKELSVRKVLGAGPWNTTILVMKQFLKLVLWANILAWPVTWWLMSRWLEGFAYHVDIDPAVFVLSGALTFLIALFTLSFQSVKVALLSPLRYLRTG